MKKVIIVLCALLCITVLLLSGCYSKTDYPVIRDLTYECVNEYGETIKELYIICKEYNIKCIRKLSEEDDKDKGIVINSKGSDYFVVISDGQEIDSENEDIQKACDYVDSIMDDYTIRFVIYYPSMKKMEIWFKDGFIDADVGIVYPLLGSPKAVPDKEIYEEITDGIYLYIYFNAG